MDQSRLPSADSNPNFNSSPPADVSPAPPPWVLKAKLYLFTTLLNPVNREDPVLQGLPSGTYSPSENVHPSALAPINDAPQWNGGLTGFVLVRYEDSPIGPYDELIVAAHGFANPYEKSTSSRITNIYVSSRQSVWNGRNNWNIPKRLARFEYLSTGSRTSTFKVFLPDADTPFFAASITDSRIPSVPVLSFLLNPLMRMVQPPLLASDPPDDIQIKSNEEWLSITPTYHGRWSVAYIRPAEAELQRYGDGLHFPQIKPFWIGARFTGSIHYPSGLKLSAE